MMRGREELENTYTIRVSNKLYRNILGRHFNYHQLAVMPVCHNSFTPCSFFWSCRKANPCFLTSIYCIAGYLH